MTLLTSMTFTLLPRSLNYFNDTNSHSICEWTYSSSRFLADLLRISSFVITLTWEISRVTIADRADNRPDTNLEGAIINCESIINTPHILKSLACRWSTSCLITGIWVYNSICPVNNESTTFLWPKVVNFNVNEVLTVNYVTSMQ